MKYFVSLGHETWGVEGSKTAIESLLLVEAGANGRLLHQDLEASRLSENAKESIEVEGRAPTMVFARFFIHSLTESGQNNFLADALSLTHPGDLLALEFRTDEDAKLSKVHDDGHSRRFIDPNVLLTKLLQKWKLLFFEQSQGLAIYKNEDPVVARILMRRI